MGRPWLFGLVLSLASLCVIELTFPGIFDTFHTGEGARRASQPLARSRVQTSLCLDAREYFPRSKRPIHASVCLR
ncbi:hypothetical protein GQ43DRAFT_436508 [Delitschia confertaspora ATCC 74209]|uniref:Secreted protein n=1 Tax=Delitschia confertaspora ATCC 74209 TaxID=1513339 RepID=A0A9P4JUL4_9PLEO|nr:hypothetical protein GQ43DRAFT_436508 [Delitschia confertaspora ATCC 74209]